MAAEYLIGEQQLSIRRACVAVKLSFSVYYYKSLNKRNDDEIIAILEDLCENHPTYGFKKMFHLLRQRGHKWNHKRVYRVYVKMGLNIRRRRKRRLPARVKTPHILPIEANITWSIDFMEDTLTTGKRFRTLNVIDDHNREALMVSIDTSITSHRLIRELDRLIEWRGAPKVIRVDNGPEFTAIRFESWAKKHGITICFIQPGKPTQNCLIERFNRSYRQEVLNAYLFETLNQARDRTQQWMWQYNNIRPHQSLGNKSPVKFMSDRGKTSFPSFLPDQELMENNIFISASI